MKNIEEYKTVFFLGIGGIGMSALARYCLFLGKSVIGYDRTESKLCQTMVAEGATIFYEDSAEIFQAKLKEQNAAYETTLVVRTPAIRESAILEFCSNNHLVIKKRAEVLGLLSQEPCTIAVAGTHGKTTTSSLVTHLMKNCGFSIAAFLGGISENLQSNFYFSGNEYVVAEADEYDRSFLHLHPDWAIITSTDADHLDIYKNKEEFAKGFALFADLVPKGKLLYRYGLEFTEKGFSYAVNDSKAEYYSHSLVMKGEEIEFIFQDTIQNQSYTFSWNIPGVHNVENATAAIALLLQLGADPENIKDALKSFTGIKRRYTKQVFSDGTVYIDDYAHHPTELQAVMCSIRSFNPNKKLLTIFQPHLYSRTRDFMQDFAQVLSTSDHLILIDIYPARENEEDFPGVSSRVLSDLITLPSVHVCPLGEALDSIKEEIKKEKPDIILTAGAGDIDSLYEPLCEFLNSFKNEE